MAGVGARGMRMPSSAAVFAHFEPVNESLNSAVFTPLGWSFVAGGGVRDTPGEPC